MLNLIFNFKSCHISNYAALHVDEPQQSWDVLLEEPLHLAGVRWIMKLNDWFPMFPHRFGSSVWHTHLKTLETLTLTLGLPHTHTHTRSLLGNRDPILGCVLFDTPPLEIENQVKFPVESDYQLMTQIREALGPPLLSWDVEIPQERRDRVNEPIWSPEWRSKEKSKGRLQLTFQTNWLRNIW